MTTNNNLLALITDMEKSQLAERAMQQHQQETMRELYASISAIIMIKVVIILIKYLTMDNHYLELPCVTGTVNERSRTTWSPPSRRITNLSRIN